MFSGLLASSAFAETRGSNPLAVAHAILRGEGALADFDGDHRPDSAVAEPGYSAKGRGYRISVDLSGNPSHAFEVASGVPGGLRIIPFDVDGDDDLDLVITTEHGRQPVGVWINDGTGVFSQDLVTKYPSFIWEESRTWFEAPGQTETRIWLLATPATANRPPPVNACALLPKPGSGWLYVLLERPDFRLGHSSGPLRAPPLV